MCLLTTAAVHLTGRSRIFLCLQSPGISCILEGTQLYEVKKFRSAAVFVPSAVLYLRFEQNSEVLLPGEALHWNIKGLLSSSIILHQKGTGTCKAEWRSAKGKLGAKSWLSEFPGSNFLMWLSNISNWCIWATAAVDGHCQIWCKPSGADVSAHLTLSIPLRVSTFKQSSQQSLQGWVLLISEQRGLLSWNSLTFSHPDSSRR